MADCLSLGNQAMQQMITFSRSVEHVLMKLEDSLKVTSRTCQHGNVHDITRVVPQIPHYLSYLDPMEDLLTACYISKQAIHGFRDAP